MDASTLLLRSSLTFPPFITFDTVPTDTPASCATSLIVTIPHTFPAAVYITVPISFYSCISRHLLSFYYYLELFRAKQNFVKQAENACIFKPVFEILFGGYATPTKCTAFWRLALNSYYFYLFSVQSQEKCDKSKVFFTTGSEQKYPFCSKKGNAARQHSPLI